MFTSNESKTNDENRKVPTVFDKFLEQKMIEETEDEGFYTVSQQFYEDLKSK